MQKYTISRDDSIYQAWPDLVLTSSGRLVCVFSECTHHGDRSYTRVMYCISDDRGRSWSEKKALTEGTSGLDFYYNCARISNLSDGRLAVVVDRIYGIGESTKNPEKMRVVMFFSDDDAESWSEVVETPVRGIVPDKLVELDSGRWLIGSHYKVDGYDNLVQFLRYSDDKGESWSEAVVVGRQEGLDLCEVSIMQVEGDTLVALMRENSFTGLDCYKAISHDAGASWSELIKFPLPGCHRPVCGKLADGRYMVTFRFLQGGRGWLGGWTQNFMGAFTDKESLLALRRKDATSRIFPIDYDRSSKSDLGYSGWVQFADGEIYVVNYIVDDAPKAQIRGYSFRPEEFYIELPINNL